MASFSEDTNGKSSSPRKSLRSIRSLSGRLEHSSTVTSADLFASYNASGTTHLDQSSAADLNASTRRASLSYDKSHTMDRLRSSFIADASPLQEPTDNNGNAPSHDASYDSVEDGLLHFESGKLTKRKTLRKKDGDFSSPSVGKRRPKNGWQMLQSALRQIPAIVLIGMFHLMIGIPFGVSYFPVGWRDDFSAGDGNSSDTNTGESQGEDFVQGPFPLPGKEGEREKKHCFEFWLC